MSVSALRAVFPLYNPTRKSGVTCGSTNCFGGSGGIVCVGIAAGLGAIGARIIGSGERCKAVASAAGGGADTAVAISCGGQLVKFAGSWFRRESHHIKINPAREATG